MKDKKFFIIHTISQKLNIACKEQGAYNVDTEAKINNAER